MYVEGTRQSYGDDMKTFPLRPARANNEAKALDPIAQPVVAEASEAPESVPNDTSAPRGVIQNLQEGHFRGVADVRLRINFADELQALDTEKTQSALAEGTASIQAGIEVRVEAFTASTTLAQGDLETLGAAQEDFNSRVAELLGGETGRQVASDIFAELRSSFEDFVNALLPPGETDTSDTAVVGDAGEILEPEVASVANVTASPSTTATTGEDVFQALRESLDGFFEEALASLQAFVGGLGLPELSEPQGNGRAYERFLAVYNEIYGQGSAPGTPGAETVLDTTT